jgi:NDP-sugar pyrophosphorylase family protein
MLEPGVLEYIPENTFFDFAKDVLPRLLEDGERFVVYESNFYWSDIGMLEAYRQAQYDVLSGTVRVNIHGEKRGEGLWIGVDAQIHPSATIEDHALVAEGTLWSGAGSPSQRTRRSGQTAG